MPSSWRRVCWPVLLLLLAALTLGGCLDAASNKDYAFDNPVDPNPDTSNTEGAGFIRIELVVPVTGEQVLVHNGSTADVDMAGWMIKGNTTQDVFTFPTFTLSQGKIVRVHSASGTNSSTDLYDSDWVVSAGSPGDHFNGTNDSAELYDSDGNLIDTCSSSDTSTCWAN